MAAKIQQRQIKKSALSNVPRGSDADTQRFLDELRTELSRVSGMAVDALQRVSALEKQVASLRAGMAE